MKKLIYLVFAGALVLSSCDNGGTEPDPVVDKSTTFTEKFLFVGSDTVKYITIEDKGEGIGTRTLTKNIVYILNGLVYVNEGQTLTIEPGTIIKGESGQGENASALVVARGAKIMAEGTKAEPIIFTSEADQIDRTTTGKRIGSNNLGKTTSGLWGGVIVLGNAKLNSNPGQSAIEGIPTNETRGLYGAKDGATNDADNSGVLKYISIRHGGTNIGAGNEINGLTLGGVGSGTTIDYVEVIANEDDGIEFFGGTVNAKHLLVSNCKDDGFDYDEGFRGKGQFWVALNAGGSAGEFDGGTNPETATPYATPTIYNMTMISPKSVVIRDNAGGFFRNSIFDSFTSGPTFDIEDLASGDDSKKHHVDGNLVIENNVFANCVGLNAAYRVYSGSTSTVETTERAVNSTIEANSIVSATNPVPATPIAATSVTADSFFENAAYMGAFNTSNWAAGWTLTFPTAE